MKNSNLYRIHASLILGQLGQKIPKKNKASLHEYDRSISQLHLYLARAFYQKGSMPEAGLLTAQVEETIIGDGGSWSEYYNDIVFFDKYATLEDMDNTFEFYYKLNKKIRLCTQN